MTRKPTTNSQGEQEAFNVRKRALLRSIQDHELSLFEATLAFRKLLGMTQAEYGAKVIGLSRNQVAAIEKGNANPTLKTLQAIGRPFGLELGFVPRRKP